MYSKNIKVIKSRRKEDKMGEACGIYGGDEKEYSVLGGRTEETIKLKLDVKRLKSSGW